ncbi:sodium/nucleoside cotransporter 1-like isoform X1 [Penaeus chinensis]|uniref:sodium/nucleoside cotransporter 1-like isoform X1 n=1 Tax=Penaeus chinensis TaxID=139456 RepID=UPI001FB761FD|nr:sodium/nucleoside cotransporter 1-like isoform X1 [Penaeus chinensis]XP_047473661.1 sodium/nucleoside cotransporter 1-like isoform X1 [Penaeus chinensis]
MSDPPPPLSDNGAFDNPSFDHDQEDVIAMRQLPTELPATQTQDLPTRSTSHPSDVELAPHAPEMGKKRTNRHEDDDKGDNGDKSDEEEEEDYSLLTMIPNYIEFKESMHRALPIKEMQQYRHILFSILFGGGFVMYFAAVLIIKTKIEEEWSYWCEADGLLIVLTSLVALGIFYFQVLKRLFGKNLPFSRAFKVHVVANVSRVSSKVPGVLVGLVLLAGALVFVVLDSWNDRVRLQSLLGVATLIAFGFLFSAAPRKVRWRHVGWGMGLQFVLGLVILRWPLGKAVFQCAADKVTTFLAFTDEGSEFVFGKLVSEMEIFAFKVLSVILFFSFCIQILYYWGVMQWVVIKLGWVLQVTVGTTACESVNAAANIFLGQTEAPLLIKPYLPFMTKSELHAVMTGGFATIAGSVLAAYISFGVDPAHLISASVMNAPAALAFSKLFYPETKKSKTSVSDIKMEKGEESSWLHAAMVGVTNAIPLVANIAANLIAFYAFIALCSHVFDWTCRLAGAEEDVCTLENVFGVLFTPLAFVMGVNWSECDQVGKLIGLKIIVNEFMAYEQLSQLIEAGAISKRAETIATYALCGFSNISSIGINLGGFSAMAPDRKADLASVVVRAMIAGSCATFLTACVAGTLLPSTEESFPFNMTSTTELLESTTASCLY